GTGGGGGGGRGGGGRGRAAGCRASGRASRRLDQPAKRLAACLEVAELVVARAGRREQDDVAGRRVGGSLRERLREVSCAPVLAARQVERARELGRGLADQVDRADGVR